MLCSQLKKTSLLSNEKIMKLSKIEREIIKSRRKFTKIKVNSDRIIRYRKSSIPSKGEQKVIDFLNSEKIEFKREYYFKGLYNNKTNQLLYFDFYLPYYHCCIEYDGEQHYSKEKTENQRISDFLKNSYCAKNNIPFLRIKYTDFNNIELLICKLFDNKF